MLIDGVAFHLNHNELYIPAVLAVPWLAASSPMCMDPCRSHTLKQCTVLDSLYIWLQGICCLLWWSPQIQKPLPSPPSLPPSTKWKTGTLMQSHLTSSGIYLQIETAKRSGEEIMCLLNLIETNLKKDIIFIEKLNFKGLGE